MPLVLKDRVLETCSAPGTGAVALLGATVGYQTFLAAVGNANTTYYTIADQSGSNYEIGIGTYTASGNTLARTTILASSNGGAVVNFNAGTQNVFVTYAAGKSVNLDASGNVSPLGIIASGTWQGTTLGVAYGGTGATTLTGYVKGNGTSAMTAFATVPTTDLSGTITNAQLANSAITINGTSTALGGSISVGTVTSVTGTAPVVSSGGATPAISMAAANTTTNGYLTSTDWNTFNSKQPAGTYVNSVSATSPITSTGGVTPTIAMPAATTSVNGYLTSTDWTTFNSKAPAVTYTTSYVPYGQGTTTPNQNINFTFDGTTLSAPVQRASNGIVTNNKTIAANYTIPASDNAVSVGPVTVNSGIVITVSSGSRYVIL